MTPVELFKLESTPSVDPSLSVDPSSISFGSVAINPSSAYTQTFDVTFANLTQALTVTGFTGVTVSPSTIATNASSPATVTVSYNPTTAGNLSGSITVGNTADNLNETVSVTGSAYDPATAPRYELYSGTITEGDYVIYYNGKAMKNTVSSNRLDYTTVTPAGNNIVNPDASIVWHIAPDGNYWTIYSAAVSEYAASTGSKNQATLVSSVTDNAKWTVTGTETYDFENLARSNSTSDPNNKWLRNNDTYGFACYASGTGGELSLYKLAVANQVATPTFSPASCTITEATSVTLSCATTGATIYYTLDGSTPTTSSTQYTGAITVNATTTIKAIAVMSGMTNSNVAEATYTRLYNITVNQPTTGGTITASPLQAAAGATITLTKSANVGYAFSAWNITPSTITVSNDAFTMPEQDVTVSATFTTATTYTVSFSINSKIEMTATVNSGATIDMNKFIADVTTEGYLFDGWYTAASGGTKVADSYQPSADVTVYAQFGSAPTAQYSLVTSVTDLQDGDHVIITPQGSNNTALSKDQRTNNRNATVEAENHVIKSPASGSNAYSELSINPNYNDVCELVLGEVTVGGNTYWTFYDPNYVDDDNNVGGYLYSADPTNENYLRTQHANTADGEWTISISNKVATIYSHGGTTDDHVYLKYNTRNKIFSSYLQSSGNTQYIYLYRKTTNSAKATRDVNANAKVTAIASDVLVTVKNQGIVYLTGANAGNETNLVVEDGGQLFTSANVKGTMLKGVTGYGNNTAASNYYLISTPLTTNTNPRNVLHMINTAGYDLYYFDQNPDQDPNTGIGLEWRNYKAGNGFSLYVGSGYLYANSESLDLEFAGTLRKSIDVTTPFSKNITCEGTQNWAGWNLIGNPYSVNATLSTCDFYEMKSDGSEIITATSSVVKPMQGIFAYTDGTVTSVTFTPGETNAKSSGIVINVTNENQLLDRAIVRFDNGNMLPKFQLNPNSTKVYITEGNQDFAVVRSGNDGEMPVSFKAETNGTYTLSADITELEMNYLHLIDNMTGADVDLLATPSYTFDARTTDYTSRFRLVFSGNNVNENTNTTETFAFFNGESWSVSNQGEATLQVIDVLGRLVNTQTINGNTTLSLNQTPGIYMLRLVNGNDVKVQKIVVR